MPVAGFFVAGERNVGLLLIYTRVIRIDETTL